MPKEPVATDDAELWTKIGAQIERYREAAGLTHAQLASAVGLSRSYMTRLINGKRRPNVNQLERIAKAFRVEVSGLVPAGAGSVPDGAATDPDRTISFEPDDGGDYTVKTAEGSYVAQKLDAIEDDDVRARAMEACSAAIREALHPPRLGAGRRPGRAQGR